MFAAVAPTGEERRASMVGDDIVVAAAVTMDRAFTVAVSPDVVFPWLVQLGKNRAGWYLPASVERFLPAKRRAIRHLDPQWLSLGVGDVTPDYGGRDETLTVVRIQAPTYLAYYSKRGGADLSWVMELAAIDGQATRIHLRLRVGPLKHPRLIATFGDVFDLLTIAGVAAGLKERLAALAE
jgi:hypothetical protein